MILGWVLMRMRGKVWISLYLFIIVFCFGLVWDKEEKNFNFLFFFKERKRIECVSNVLDLGWGRGSDIYMDVKVRFLVEYFI